MLTLTHVDKALVGPSSDCEIFANLCLKLYRWRSHIAYTILTALVWPKSGWSKVGKSTRNAAAIYKTPRKNCRGHVIIAGQCLPMRGETMVAWVLSLGQQSAVSAARYSHIWREGCYQVSPCTGSRETWCCNCRMCNLFEQCSYVPASMFVIGDVLGCATGGLFADRWLRVISIFYERQVSINVSNLCTHTRNNWCDV